MKFGELITKEPTTVLCFYYGLANNEDLNKDLRDLAARFGGATVKIDVDKNEELADALRVITLPTFLIYKDGEMALRTLKLSEVHGFLNWGITVCIRCRSDLNSTKH